MRGSLPGRLPGRRGLPWSSLTVLSDVAPVRVLVNSCAQGVRAERLHRVPGVLRATTSTAGRRAVLGNLLGLRNNCETIYCLRILSGRRLYLLTVRPFTTGPAKCKSSRVSAVPAVREQARRCSAARSSPSAAGNALPEPYCRVRFVRSFSADARRKRLR